MKKYRIFSLILLVLLLFSSCNINQVEKSKEKKHQELKNDVITYNQDEMFRISLAEAGLENVFIQQATGFKNLDNDSSYCQVFLLGYDLFDKRTPCDFYLAVLIDDKVYLQDLGICYASKIELCDFDGDDDKEILLQETIGATGGAGQYKSTVLDFENGEFKELFLSWKGKDGKFFDTGFSIEILKGNKFKIKNSITNYNEIFAFKYKTNKYLKSLYDENGEPVKQQILVDSFFEFIPNDIDNDGVYEIVCRQYVSLIDHADHIGNVKTIIKYNNKTSSFEIIDAEFEERED